MFNININNDELKIANLESEDIAISKQWIRNYRDFFARYIESYVSENETFLKVCNDEKIIGFIKCRFEFKKPGECWFWFIVIDEKIRCKGIGSKAVKYIEEYLKENYGIHEFYAVIDSTEKDALSFWKKNSYNISRISEGFFHNNGKNSDMFVLKKY